MYSGLVFSLFQKNTLSWALNPAHQMGWAVLIGPQYHKNLQEVELANPYNARNAETSIVTYVQHFSIQFCPTLTSQPPTYKTTPSSQKKV